jgi:hypothetical protein
LLLLLVLFDSGELKIPTREVFMLGGYKKHFTVFTACLVSLAPRGDRKFISRRIFIYDLPRLKDV